MIPGGREGIPANERNVNRSTRQKISHKPDITLREIPRSSVRNFPHESEGKFVDANKGLEGWQDP